MIMEESNPHACIKLAHKKFPPGNFCSEHAGITGTGLGSVKLWTKYQKKKKERKKINKPKQADFGRELILGGMYGLVEGSDFLSGWLGYRGLQRDLKASAVLLKHRKTEASTEISFFPGRRVQEEGTWGIQNSQGVEWIPGRWDERTEAPRGLWERLPHPGLQPLIARMRRTQVPLN